MVERRRILFGKIGGERVEVGAALGDLVIHAVDGVDAEQAVVLLRVLGLPHLAGDVVTRAQSEAADLRLGDIDVVGAGSQRWATEEAESVVDDVDRAVGEDGAVASCLLLEDAVDQFGPGHSRGVFDVESVNRELDQYFAVELIHI